MKTRKIALSASLALAALPAISPAANLLTPGDFIIAIDTDNSGSRYPIPNETPSKVLDAVATTKYLNFGRENSGFIVTPASGPSIIQSFILTTANDASNRDPASWSLFGTNAAIISPDNSHGDVEAWTAIANGTVDLPLTRLTAGPVVSFANANSYASYKLVFNTLRNAPATNSMQVADAAFYQSNDGTGSNVLASTDPILAIDTDYIFTSSHPTAESPDKAIDGTLTKYLNFGQKNSGVIVTPSVGRTVVKGFQLTTANDSPERDPSAWAIYGTDAAIVSVDNSWGDAEPWTLITTGTVDLPTDRNTLGPLVEFTNDAQYDSYKLVFTNVRDPGTANSMQVAEIQFIGDVVPEPSSLLGLAAAGLALSLRRRRA